MENGNVDLQNDCLGILGFVYFVVFDCFSCLLGFQSFCA